MISVFYSQDMDVLIHRIKGNDTNLLNNFIEIQIKMTILGYGNEFIHFLFEIVDEGFTIDFHHGEYDDDEILDNFDNALQLEDKLLILSKIGNDIFGDFVTERMMIRRQRDLVMITSFVRLLIDSRLFVTITSAEENYSNMF